MNDLLSIILSAVGVILSGITFMSTIQIRKMLKRESDKKQFYRERYIYIEKLKEYERRICKKDFNSEKLIELLMDIHITIEQISIFKIWDEKQLSTFKKFKEVTIHVIEDITDPSGYEVNTDKERETERSSDLEFVLLLNEVIAIIQIDSSVE